MTVRRCTCYPGLHKAMQMMDPAVSLARDLQLPLFWRYRYELERAVLVPERSRDMLQSSGDLPDRFIQVIFMYRFGGLVQCLSSLVWCS